MGKTGENLQNLSWKRLNNFETYVSKKQKTNLYDHKLICNET